MACEAGYFTRVAAEVRERDRGCLDGDRVDTSVAGLELPHRRRARVARLPVARERPLHPVALGPAFRVGRPEAELLRDVGQDAVVALRFARRFNHLRRDEHLVAVLPSVGDAPRFELRAGRQDEVREARRGREEVVLYRDELDEPFVLQDLRRLVDVRVLVYESVRGDGIDELDVGVEAVGPSHALVGAQLFAAGYRLGPEERRD